MTLPVNQTALNAGELSPQLYGRVDLAKYKSGCSTLRNFVASYRGGVFTRPGTLYVGTCKQGNKGNALNVPPPRDIPFQYSTDQGITIEAGQQYFRFISNGAYITENQTTITGITLANPAVVTDTAHGYSNGDEVFLSLNGLVQLSGQSFEVSNVTTNTYTLVSVLDGSVISTIGFQPFVSGTAARIYTLATPYAASDLPLLKFIQSADVMSFTHPSYPPYDLSRITVNDWTMVKTVFTATIAAPTETGINENVSAGTASFWYSFVATAVSGDTGEESVASPVAYVESVDIASQAGTLVISCAAVAGASSYNFYQAPVAYEFPPTGASLFGFIGSSFGPQFSDSNVTPDYSTTPPTHQNPFATSSVTAVVMTAPGSGYNSTGTTATATSPIGQNPVFTTVVQGGEITWIVVANGGAGMTGGEAVNIVDSTGGGSGAAATLSIGPATGTWPGCVSYFQQRRIYANTNNQPDTYFASQPGAFTNFDSSVPTQDSDAIIGSPWSQQVNGIQFMMNMPGGLVIFTGLGAWQLSGAGSGLSTSAALTPANQVANPQAYNGCSSVVPPIAINYDILYVQEKGSIVRDLSYNFFVNIYTGTDMTVLSNHLFDNHLILQWGWAEEPNKLLWAVRDDGILLCLTYLKEQDVYAWSRHDTNGLFQSVCTISEPPVNAPYFIVQRLIQNNGNPVWVNYQERMDNRDWGELANSWCVDAGLDHSLTSPDATLSISSTGGVPTLVQPTLVYGGSNYSPMTFARVVDPTGTGAVASVVITNGVVTSATVGGSLTGYTQPVFQVIDPTGAGGGAAVNISFQNIATLTATSGVFANASGQGEAGDIVRMGGRVVEVTEFVSSTELIGNVLKPWNAVIPNDPLMTPVPVDFPNWNIAAPIQTLHGLNHLEGMTVSVLADGIAQNPQVVSGGSITLEEPASAIIVGLGFTAQVQTLYLDVPSPASVQGRRKMIDNVIVRVAQTGLPFQVGTNQPDASVQPNMTTMPWTNMTGIQGPVEGNTTPIQPYDFAYGDLWCNVFDQFGMTNAQVAAQQTEPLPLTILSIVVNSRLDDDVDDGR